MQCIGRTKKNKRCKNEARFIFCRIHSFKPLLLIFVLGTGVIWATDLFESIGLKKPIEYVKSVVMGLESDDINNIIKDDIVQLNLELDKHPNKIKIGILNLKDIKGDENNLYHEIYSNELNKLATEDSLSYFSFPITLKEFGIPNDSTLKKIINTLNLNILVWGSYLDQDCTSEDLYCINYKLRDNIESLNFHSFEEQIFIEGNFQSFLEGKLSGQLHEILYGIFILSEIADNDYINALKLIENYIQRNEESLFFLFWKAFSYFHLNDNNKALILFKKIQKNTIDACSKELINSYSYTASIKQKNGLYREQVEDNLKALKLYQNCQFNFPLILASIYNNIGHSYSLINRVDSSEIYFRKTIDLINEYKENSIYIPFLHSNLATLYIHSNDYQSAIQNCIKGIEYTKNNEEHFNNITDVLYTNLGASYIKLEEYQKAVSALSKAKNILIKKKELLNPKSMGTIIELGFAFIGIDNDSLAFENKLLADEIFNSNELTSENLYRYHEFNCIYLSKLNKFTESLYHCNLSLEIAKRFKFRSEYFIKNSYYNLSITHLLNDNIEEAKKYILLAK